MDVRAPNPGKTMENPTSFDLNLAISEWRKSVEQMPGFDTQNLRELETHLRDSVATLQRKDLSPEESFVVAVRRIGPATELAAEFRKVNRREVWLDRALWMLAGVQMFVMIRGLARVTGDIALLLGSTFSMSRTALVLLAGVFYVLSFCVVTYLVWRLMQRPPLPVQRTLGRLFGHSVLTAVTIIVASVLLTAIGSAPIMFLVHKHGIAAAADTNDGVPVVERAIRSYSVALCRSEFCIPGQEESAKKLVSW